MACPIIYDAQREEPYVPIPDFPELRLTPYREDDIPDMITLWSDPLIGKWALRRPYPYTAEDARWFLDNFIRNDIETLRLFFPHFTQSGSTSSTEAQTSPEPTSRPNRAFPLGALRYVPTGEGSSGKLDALALGLRPGQLLGNFGMGHSDAGPPKTSSSSAVFQSKQGQHQQDTNGTEGTKETAEKPLIEGESTDDSSARGEWEIAYDILPKLGGRGIGKRMVKAGMAWGFWLGADRIVAHAQVENIPSAALLRTSGFERTGSFMQKWPEEKGGGEREIAVWVYRDDPTTRAQFTA